MSKYFLNESPPQRAFTQMQALIENLTQEPSQSHHVLLCSHYILQLYQLTRSLNLCPLCLPIRSDLGMVAID